MGDRLPIPDGFSIELLDFETQLVTSYVFPIFWAFHTETDEVRVRNGTGFVVDTGSRVFGVTAAHVIAAESIARQQDNYICTQFGKLDVVGLTSHIIDSDPDLDLATFDIDFLEEQSLGVTRLEGNQRAWPPLPPEQSRGIVCAGFPEVGVSLDSPDEFLFDGLRFGGIATSVSSRDVSVQIERDFAVRLAGLAIPGEDFQFSGISGSPILAIVESRGVRSWRLGGVVYEGPNPEGIEGESIQQLQIIRARRPEFIGADGSLDRDFVGHT